MERTKSEGNININNQSGKSNKTRNKLLQKTKSSINFKNCYDYSKNNTNNKINNNNINEPEIATPESIDIKNPY